jgi:hypothetical protein
MKNLLIVVLTVASLLFLADLHAQKAAPAKQPQLWEYQAVGRIRTFSKGQVATPLQESIDPSPTGWVDKDGKSLNAEDLLKRMGDQGWELVTVVTRSNGTSPWSAGTTHEDLWVFKRPKS